jgi:cytochrome c-type biogenesis CcmH protein
MQRPSSYKASNQFRTLWSVVSISTILTLGMAQGDSADARYKKLGHRMICTCDSEPATGMGQRGCKQILLECSHVDCKPSKNMRRELSEALQRGDSDDAILSSFVQKYGTDVVEGSSRLGSRLICSLAAAALISVAIAFVWKRRSRPAPGSMPLSDSPDANVFRDRVLRDTENDDWY